MSRRTRLESKLEKRKDWADSRRSKSSALLARNEPYHGDIAFNTQPGHISERARVIRRSDKAAEHYGVALHHEEKADGIQHQLDRSIFSDDTDAITALESHITDHEAARERIRLYNASCRRAAKSGQKLGDLSILSDDQCQDLLSLVKVCPYQVRDGGAFPAYTSSNLSGRIKADRDRIEQIRRQASRTQAATDAGGIVITRHPDINWCTITFQEKPDRDIIKALKEAGYGWGGGSWSGYLDRLPGVVVEMEEGSDR